MSERGRGQYNKTSNSGGVVFWMLLLMGFGVLAPSVLWPEWRDYQQLQETRAEAQYHLDAINRVVDQEKRLLLAMQTDPGVISRIAQRDLKFSRDGEQSIPVDVSLVSSDVIVDGRYRSERAAGDDRTKLVPPMLQRLAQLTPDLNYDQIFGSPQTRTILIAMSTALIALAFMLFGVRRTTAEP